MEPRDSEPFRRSRIQLYSRLKLKNIFPGEWESIYTGDGIEFMGIKPFEPGDDLRDLDLYTLVRSGEEEIVERVVGRQMNVFIWADFSGSMQKSEEAFFPAKREIRDNAIGMLAFSAWNAYSPVGLCAFNKEIRRFFPAGPGESYCTEMMDWVLDQEYTHPVPADVPNALAFLMERAFPQSLVFFISDFQDPVFEDDFSDLIKPAAKKFDFITVVIRDPLETIAPLPRSAIVSVSGDEGGGERAIYLTPRRLREIQEISARHLSHLQRNFRRAGVDHTVLDSPSLEHCYEALSGLFQTRRRMPL
jgi:uncharacterized protein (DUF58 family)